MSIAGLWNHRAVLYRATVTRDAYGGTVETWVAQPVPDGNNCRPNQAWSGSLQDHGPGEQQGAMRQWFVSSGFGAAERDVLSVEEGAESPLLLRVESVTLPTRRGGAAHHAEVNVQVWTGSLT